MDKTSSNERKYHTSNPVKRALLAHFTDALVRQVGLLKPTRLLEAGCGEGFVTKSIIAAYPNISINAIDIDPDTVEKARWRNPAADITKGNVTTLDFDDDSFDLVLCTEVLEHLEEPHLALDETCPVSNKYVILSVLNEPLFRLLYLIALNHWALNHWRKLGNTPGHINHWGLRGLYKLVQPHIEVITTINPPPWNIVVGYLR